MPPKTPDPTRAIVSEILPPLIQPTLTATPVATGVPRPKQVKSIPLPVLAALA